MTRVIEIENLSKRFGSTCAVDSLTLAINAGEIFGCLGHNGAGKTTTVRLLNGVLAPTEGKVRTLGMDPVHEGHLLRRRTGVLTETPALDERLTGRENLALFAELYGVPSPEVKQRVRELLAEFGLEERADDPVGSFSRGMKQRLALARALAHRPEILFLDEPTSGLDPLAARDVHALILSFSKQSGRTVFLCTHNLGEAQKLCDRLMVMERGRLMALGSPRQLAQNLGWGINLELELAPEESAKAQAVLRVFSQGVKIGASEKHIVRLHLPDRELISQVVARLVQAQVRLYRLIPIEPTLEDVYFALHGQKERPV